LVAGKARAAVRARVTDAVEVTGAPAQTVVAPRAILAEAKGKIALRGWAVDTVEVVAAYVVTVVMLRAVPPDTAAGPRAIPEVVADEVGQAVRAGLALRIRAADVTVLVERST
jgi:hypothetical protein